MIVILKIIPKHAIKTTGTRVEVLLPKALCHLGCRYRKNDKSVWQNYNQKTNIVMLLSDNEYMKLNVVLIIISDIIAGGYIGDKDFIKKAKKFNQDPQIDIELIKKIARRLELIST